jgi:thiol:disulfide interchange protein DsbA
MLRRLLAALALTGAAFLPVAVPAQQPVPFLELNPPLPTDAAGKIEVVEFFWYECPHCYSLEPRIEAWLKNLPKDVQFRRVPAMFNQQWALSGRVFYTLEAIGELDRLHKPLFDAIHKGGLKITNMKQLQDWLERQKVDLGKFNAAFKSFAVESRLKRALELTTASRIESVPQMMVNGRYLVSADSAKGDMLLVVNVLIEQARKPVASAAPKK